MTGYAQHGKDSTACFIKDHARMQVEKIAFADPIRQMALSINPYIVDPTLDQPTKYKDLINDLGYENSKKLPEVRRLLQVLGTEAGRDLFGTNVWIDVLDKNVRKSTADLVVVTDVRFANEVDYIKRNGLLWAIARVNYDNGLSKVHPSEAYIAAALKRADHIITARTLDELQRRTLLALTMLN